MALVTRLARPSRQAAGLAAAAWPQFMRPLVFELAAHRPIRELLPGVYHWTRIHPRIKLPVDSYCTELAGVVLDLREFVMRPNGAARPPRGEYQPSAPYQGHEPRRVAARDCEHGRPSR